MLASLGLRLGPETFRDLSKVTQMISGGAQRSALRSDTPACTLVGHEAAGPWWQPRALAQPRAHTLFTLLSETQGTQDT